MKTHLLPASALCLLLAACQRDAAPVQPSTPPAKGGAAAPVDVQPAASAADATPAPAGEDVAGPANMTSAKTDRTHPALSLPTVDGGHYDLAQRRGKWVVVNFWATWCGPCLKEMPELSALHAMRQHVEVVGLAYEDTSLDEMRDFLKEHPVTYPIAMIDVSAPPVDFDTPRALPTTYLIAPDGRVAHQFLGPVTAKDIEQQIAAAGGPGPKA